MDCCSNLKGKCKKRGSCKNKETNSLSDIHPAAKESVEGKNINYSYQSHVDNYPLDEEQQSTHSSGSSKFSSGRWYTSLGQRSEFSQSMPNLNIFKSIYKGNDKLLILLYNSFICFI